MRELVGISSRPSGSRAERHSFEEEWCPPRTLLFHQPGEPTQHNKTPQAAGATVIAAASTGDKLQACRDSGADLLLDYRQGDGNGGGRRGGDWRGALKRLTGGRGVDVVLDNVGGADCEVSAPTRVV